MILFCDTSALVKLYIAEEGSDILHAQVVEAHRVAVCRIAWAEMMAAFARRAREVPTAATVIDSVRARLQNDWPAYLVVEITQALVEQAGDYADLFALRGYDSIQLAAGRILQQASDEPVVFACFDTRLARAAASLGLSGA